jgi:hypothetical protein
MTFVTGDVIDIEFLLLFYDFDGTLGSLMTSGLEI